MARLNVFEFGFIELNYSNKEDEQISQIELNGEVPEQFFFCYIIQHLNFSYLHYSKIQLPKDYCKFNIITTKEHLELFFNTELENKELIIFLNAIKHLL